MASKVIVYVEGKSDQEALKMLLAPLLEQCAASGTAFHFVSLEGKQKVMGAVPQRAVNILPHDPNVIVVALPDLYPANMGGPHQTAAELRDLVTRSFRSALRTRLGREDDRIASRFHVHCFKHDLEALVLAAPAALASRLGVANLPVTWTVPVEDHNHGNPPKRVVERLFEQHHDTYQAAVDAPLILGKADYREVAEACPQCFKPLVELFESLCAGETC